MRSGLTTEIVSAISSIAASVGASTAKANPAANRTARTHPQLVFGKPCTRVADGADHAPLEIGQAVDVIDHALFKRIVEQAIDREIAALGILFWRAENHRIRMPPVAIFGIAAERRDFDHAGVFRAQHGHDAERRADG